MLNVLVPPPECVIVNVLASAHVVGLIGVESTAASKSVCAIIEANVFAAGLGIPAAY